MATQQEEIAAKISLDSSAFARGIRSVEQSAKDAAKSFLNLGGTFASLFALSSLKTFANDVIQFADGLKNASESLGVSTGFLQTWNQAMLQSGASTEQATTSLTKFVKLLGDAQSGSESALKLFRELGVNISTDNGFKSTEVVLKTFADKVKEIGSDSERLNKIMEVFGKGAAPVAALLKDGSKALDEFVASTAKLTPEQIKSIATLDDVLDQISTRTKVAGGDVATFLGTIFENAFTKPKAFLGVYGAAFDFAKSKLDSFNKSEKERVKIQEDVKKNAGFTPQTASEIDKERKANLDAAVLKNKIEQQRNDFLTERIKKLREIGDVERQLTATKQDRSKFTLAELAAGNANGVGGQLRQDVLNARRVIQLEFEGRRLANAGQGPGASQAAFNLADQIRGGIANLVSGERRPFGALEDRIQEQNKNFNDFLVREQQRGINVVPVNGK